MVNIGILGTGGIAQAHVRGWLKCTDVARVTALADVSEENLRQTQERLGGVRAFRDFHALLKEADVDAVDICLPHHLHAEAILAAAAAGKHALCEKPLCVSGEEARAIRAAQKESGITIMCAHNQIFSPAVQRAKERIDRGDLGRVFAVRTCDCFQIRRTAAEWGWRAKLATAGGGELIDTGYHPTYLLLYLAGARPVQVMAMAHNYAQPLIEGEDAAQVLVRFENGAVGHIITSWAWDWPEGAWQFQVIGEKGQMYGRDRTFFFKPLGGEPQRDELPAADGFEAETRHFAECLARSRRPVQTADDGIAVLEVILGAYASNRSGQAAAVSVA